MPETTWTLLTAPTQGAIAIVQLSGDVAKSLAQLTTTTNWKAGELRLVTIPNIDEAVAVLINEHLAHIMPHGGVHILRKLANRFEELGITKTDDPQFPEAKDDIEAATLHTLSIAKSPLAVELLLSQPKKLRGRTPTQKDLERSNTLNHLIVPPKVVLLGAPNTGKSTLMNALTKQDTSIVHDLPGATRDAVGARINCSGLVIDIYDLPGFRDSDDPIEQEAIQLAKKIASEASLTILIADSKHDFFETNINAIRVATKSDIQNHHDADVCVSAHSGENMQELAIAIRDAIIPPEVLESDEPWFFYSPTEEKPQSTYKT
ncbi:MAG: GTP-binding protein [Phycisphaerae bacterium]|nr:GTP-binding protein [Phycisphaerae bacterium]